MRAYLILPPDDPNGFEPAFRSEADALVLDARHLRSSALVSGTKLSKRRSTLLYARVGKLSTPDFGHVLSAAMAVHADAIVLPSTCARDIAHLGALLAVAEAESGRRDGETRIVALVDAAEGALNVARFAKCSARLDAIGWDARAVATDLSATVFDDAGAWSASLAQARGLVRLAAAAAGVEAIDDFALGAGEASTVACLSEASAAGFGAILTADPALVRRIREAR